MQWSQDTAMRRARELNIDDIPLVCHRPVLVPVDPNWFARYKTLTHEFMQTLTDSVDTLAFMNLTQDEFMGLVMGTRLPDNMSFRFRIPLVWGGKLGLENLFMCQTFPHAYNMDRLIIEQSGNDMIWLPNPAKKIYVPAHTAGGGDSGNATDDRLSQMAAQMASARGMK